MSDNDNQIIENKLEFMNKRATETAMSSKNSELK
jgi:hypothetical protein